MLNPYETRAAKIVKITDLSKDIKLFEFDLSGGHFRLNLEEKFSYQPGQFIILSLPGFGEAPFAPCNKAGKNLELCVRAVGKMTNKLHTLKVGDKVGIRGPFGNGWPIAGAQVQSSHAYRQAGKFKVQSEKRNLLIVVGGLGLVPLRTLIFGKNELLGRDTLVQIFYGAKTPEDFLFRDDFDGWKKNGVDLQLTVDNKCEGWDGCVGLVTSLFDTKNIVPDAKVFLCGPPVMYKFALQKAKEKKFKDSDIFLSFERRMHCGVGVCQHCGVGSFYTCKHGPVFLYNKIKDVIGAL